MKLLLGVSGMGLLVTNCTLKSASDDAAAGASGTCVAGKVIECACPGGKKGTQSCLASSTYGTCDCSAATDGGASSGGASAAGGASSSSGATSGGANGVAAATGNDAGAGGASEAGAGGAGGEGPVVYATCDDCLADRCKAQYDACFDNPNCVSTNVDGSGQYEKIAACIDKQRVANGLVKRDVVRGCGVTIGANPAANFTDAWAPEEMDPVTTDLLNCMADAPGAAPASWANDDANYPVDSNDMINPTPWPANTCAKDACTSKL